MSTQDTPLSALSWIRKFHFGWTDAEVRQAEIDEAPEAAPVVPEDHPTTTYSAKLLFELWHLQDYGDYRAQAVIAAQAQPPGFSPMWFAPIDGTPVMLYMPTTTNKFAVGQWHGSHDSIIGNWGDDEGNYFTHTPVSFMALSNLERIANPQATAEDSSVHQQAQQAQGVPAEFLPVAVSSAPHNIWLDLGFDPYEEDAHFSNLHKPTWSEDNASGNGIKYVRADLLAAAPQAEPARRLSPFDAVAEAMRLASLMGGSIGMSDVEKTKHYEQRLRSHLAEFIYPPVTPIAPQAEPQIGEKALTEALEERDAASDYIDTLLDEVLGADRPEWTSNYGHADAMDDVRQRMADLQASATQAEHQPEREPLTAEQLHTVECMDSWAKMRGLPAYSELAGIGTKGGDKP